MGSYPETSIDPDTVCIYFFCIALFGFKQVVFEGIRGNTYTGDIALDDISFTAGMTNCSVQPSDALPPGMTTVRPTVSTPSSVSPTTISEWQFFVLIVLMTLFMKCFIKKNLIIKLTSSHYVYITSSAGVA